MATNPTKETWKYQGDTTHIDQKIDSLPESTTQVHGNKRQDGRIPAESVKTYQKEIPGYHDPHKPQNQDKIYEAAPPYQDITDAQQQAAASSYARALIDKKDIAHENYDNSVQGTYLTQDGNKLVPKNITVYRPGYSKNRPDDRMEQVGNVDDSGKAPDGTTGPVFYEGNTKHFHKQNPFRATTKEADDYIAKAAHALVGDPGLVERDADGNITKAIPRQNRQRKQTQYTLSKLSSGLLNTFNDLNPNVTDFRNVHLGTSDGEIERNIHNDDHDNYKSARTTYNEIAQSLQYLNTDGNRKWSGTLKHDDLGNISYDRSTGAGEISKHALFGTAEGAALNANSRQILRSNANDKESPYYFNPEFSNYKIKVADEKSATALAHTLRQFFDLQVLYYKKHVEILQVFQLLVIFFEKYNYSINSLMYVLEHMTKDIVKPKESEEEEEIEVAIPIDFTRSVIGMLADQKNMMNVIGTFKAHLGMNDGGIVKDTNDILLPDDNILLNETHQIHADTFQSGDRGRYPIPNAYWFPKLETEDGTPISDATFHIGNGGEVYLPRTEFRDDRVGDGDFRRPVSPAYGRRGR